jgi:WD40 repeat protein
MSDTNEENSFIKKYKISNLHKNESINSIEVIRIDNNNSIFSCSDTEIIIYETLSEKKTLLFKSNNEESELNQLKILNNHLYAANSEYLQIFDINTLKQLSNYKISRDTINSIEINKNLIACSDDLGEIKLLDMREKTLLTNKKVLKKHENICYCVKFNPSNDNELFSGSFDSTVIKWDLRAVKYISQININEVISKKQEQNNDSFISNMTPCFVHSLCFTSLNQEQLLLAGIFGLFLIFKSFI